MLHVALPLPAASETLILQAVRRWQAARASGRVRQAELSQLLAPRGAAILAPVLDSLIAIYEASLGRRIEQGASATPSSDERSLIALLDAPASAEPAEGSPSLLACALRSARVMLKLAAADR